MNTSKLIPLLIAAILTTNSLAMAGTAQGSNVLNQQKPIDQMSKEEIVIALAELRGALVEAQSNLSHAQVKDDGRVAVKLRNGFLSISAATLVGTIIGEVAIANFADDPDQILGGALLIIGGASLISGLAGSIIEEGYILITPSDVPKLQKHLNDLQAKIAAIQSRLN